MLAGLRIRRGIQQLFVPENPTRLQDRGYSTASNYVETRVFSDRFTLFLRCHERCGAVGGS
jgi:hypothetical protein